MDGVAVFVDKYLDVIFTPQGDVKIDDRDELKGLQDCDLIKASEIMNRLELQKW